MFSVRDPGGWRAGRQVADPRLPYGSLLGASGPVIVVATTIFNHERECHRPAGAGPPRSGDQPSRQRLRVMTSEKVVARRPLGVKVTVTRICWWDAWRSRRRPNPVSRTWTGTAPAVFVATAA